MKIAVLFDGAGLARLGLEQAGHECYGVELDPVAHHLGQFVGSGNCILADVRSEEATALINKCDAVWASPPCQDRSSARTQGPAAGDFAENLLKWALKVKKEVLWVENVKVQGKKSNDWGTLYNAAQFAEKPLQNRQRVIGGNYPEPQVFRDFKPYYKDMDICPCITATEYKGCASDKRRASRWFKRRATLEEVGYHMGMPYVSLARLGPDMAIEEMFEGSCIPLQWAVQPEWFEGTKTDWRNAQYRALGNGVPVWMAKKFGEAAKEKFG